MGRQRRGYFGATNLSSLPRACGHALPDHEGVFKRRLSVAKNARAAALPPVARSPATEIQSQEKRLKREPEDLDDGKISIKATLGKHIEIAQHETKSFKDESWYKSPIGFGSKASVVMAALKQHDSAGSGFIACRDVISALQACNFGLKEHQVRTLITEVDPALRDDSRIHYRSFVQKLLIDQQHSPDKGDDLVVRQQTYLEKIRQHAHQLTEKARQPTAPATLSPRAVFNPSPPTNSPVDDPEIDRLSFENDKARKVTRANAKARILLAHIHRIEEFTRHQLEASSQYDSLRIAAKARHRAEHFAHAFEEENVNLARVQKQCKGLVRCDTTRMSRNVSKDSMFYVDPV